MRTTPLFALAFALIATAIGCSHANEQRSVGERSTPAIADLMAPATEQPPPPSDPKAALSSTATTYTDSTRRFIRSGDLRFRTPDVVKTTFALEALIARHGGYVASTHLATEVNSTYTTPISADSLLETTKYTVVNRITARVPSDQLDSTLRALITFVDFLDHRTLSATDVRLSLLRDRLTQRRLARHTGRLTDAIDEKGEKLKETVSAEERLIDRQQQADEATLNTLEVEDRIAFSTLTLDVYQREAIRRQLLANEKNIKAYEPGFFSKAGEALRDGWELLQEISLALLRSWSLVLLVIAAALLYRRMRCTK